MDTLAFSFTSSELDDFLDKVAFEEPAVRTVADIFRRPLRERGDGTFEFTGTFGGNRRTLLIVQQIDGRRLHALRNDFGEALGNYIGLTLIGKADKLINTWKEQFNADR